MNDELQTTCKECGHQIWIKPYQDKYRVCPNCGLEITEQSSEDSDDGIFTNHTDSE